MECYHLVNFINSHEFRSSYNRCRDLECYLKKMSLNENIFCHLVDILNKVKNNEYIFLEYILKKIQPVKPTKYLTIEVICEIIKLVPYRKIDVLLMLEPFVVNLKSSDLVIIFQVIDISCMTITDIINTYFHKIPEIKGKDFFAILKNIGDKENIEFAADMAKIEFLEQSACKLKNYIGFIPEILSCFNDKTNIIKTTYYLILHAPDFNISYCEFVNICGILSSKSGSHFVSGFISSLIFAHKNHGWDFPVKDLTLDELCHRLSRILNTDLYQSFVAVFVNNGFKFKEIIYW
ncbi:hypothetical protein mvi_50 [Megavirus vitis]|nr:hypothetical protein mvi_50 [Megavirus vitis]